MIRAIFMLIPFLAFAQQSVSLDRSIVAESISNVHTNHSWNKDVIAETSDGKLVDRQGVLASVADASAEEETAKGIGKIASAWNKGFSNGVEMLKKKLDDVPRTGRFIGLKFPVIPATSRKFDIYVVSNYYNSAENEDVLFIYFGQSFTNAPTMVVPYVYESGFTTQRVAGTWTKPGTDDRFSKTRELSIYRNTEGTVRYKCHKLYVKRPPVLSGIPCNLDPNGVWGGPEGISFGSYLITVSVGGDVFPTYSGFVTNETLGVVAIFDNGSFNGIVPIGEEEKVK